MDRGFDRDVGLFVSGIGRERHLAVFHPRASDRVLESVRRAVRQQQARYLTHTVRNAISRLEQSGDDTDRFRIPPNQIELVSVMPQ